MSRTDTARARAAMAAGITVLLVAGIVLQYQQNLELKRQLAAARDAAFLERQKLDLIQAKNEAAQDEVNELEPEMARLRDRLANQERQNSVRAAAPATETAKTIPFTIDVKCRVANGQTLVTGGLSQDPGKHTFLLTTPQISENSSGARVVTYKSYLVEAPDEFWDRMGWTELENDASSSGVLGELDPDQVSAVFTAINNTSGATILSAPTVTAGNGEHGNIVQMDSAKDSQLSLDVASQITPDGQSVDLDMQSADVKVNPAAQSATITGLPAQ
jgi:type II secretory pathway component GspD/PulD (secretin)